MFRFLFLVALLAASIAIPFATSTAPDFIERIKASWGGSGSALSGDEVTYNGMGGALSPTTPIAPLEGMRTHELTDVLRMDVTPTWVYRRWARKSTQLAELDMHGVRVPLVTGTDADDLAGSLTYYFDANGQVQRISFRGRTGDPSRLVALVISKHGLRPRPPEVSGEQLYQMTWNGRAKSELRIRPVSMMWAGTPHTNFEIELELQRKGTNRYLNRTAKHPFSLDLPQGGVTPPQ